MQTSNANNREGHMATAVQIPDKPGMHGLRATLLDWVWFFSAACDRGALVRAPLLGEMDISNNTMTGLLSISR